MDLVINRYVSLKNKNGRAYFKVSSSFVTAPRTIFYFFILLLTHESVWRRGCDSVRFNFCPWLRLIKIVNADFDKIVIVFFHMGGKKKLKERPEMPT